MKDVYVDAFRGIVKETVDTTGIFLPESVECYVVMLLANNMDRPDFISTRSFAEAYLKINSSSKYSAKELGDACLFISGVFPLYGKKYGLNKKYYQSIGSSSYDIISETLNGELFKTLSVHFVFISEFIEEVVSPGANRTLLFK